jgi:hypothetical protein
LIAEYIRRHHYHESVSVLGHFLPIRDEKDVDDQTAAAKMAAKVDAGQTLEYLKNLDLKSNFS